MKLAKRLFVVVLLLATFATAAFAWNFLTGKQSELRETRKKLEASIAREEGFEVALETSEKERLRLLRESEVLSEKVENLGKRLEAKPKVVTKKGATVEVPVEVLVPTPEIVEVPASCVDCVESYLADLPPFAFRIAALDAVLETEGGAVVATGEVELYRTSPPPEVLLGRKEWETTTALVEKPRPEYSRLGYFVDLDYLVDPESFSFDSSTSGFVSFSEDSFRLAVGPELTFGGLTFRLGVSSDSAVRFGFSKKKRKK